MIFETVYPGVTKGESLTALKDNVFALDQTLSYAKMLNFRVDGEASAKCTDIYFVASENGKMLSRLWHGWGKHNNAIGNFGNFLTVEEARGKGIGGKLLEMWLNDVRTRTDIPLALFCTAGSEALVKLYSKFGFRLAVRGTTVGPLYLPLKDSADTFVGFCENYYDDTDFLVAKDADVEFRHEIDCLLKFALLDNGLQFGFDGVNTLEEVLMFGKGKAKILFTQSGRAVGWQYISDEGEVKTQVYPKYNGINIKM